MRRREAASPFILSFIAPRTRRNGARASGSLGDEAPNGVAQEQIAAWRKGHPFKVRLAAKLRAETTVTVRWIAHRLTMGTRRERGQACRSQLP